MKTETHPLGTLIHYENFLVLLGAKDANIETLSSSFPQLHFKRIKQVHGDGISCTGDNSVDFAQTADAHWSKDASIGLCISTADCTPLMIACKDRNLVAAVHAGWRGVANRIIPKTLQTLKDQGCDPRQMQIFIGPHIQKESFEVENSVRDELIASSPLSSREGSLWRQISPEKSLVDLHAIVLLQLQEFGITAKQIFAEKKDTKTDLNYHSFRRDKEKSGRQLSFIARIGTPYFTGLASPK